MPLREGPGNDLCPPDVSLQERLEDSRAGRWLISGMLAFVLFAIVVSSLPHSEMRRVALPVLKPALEASGLRQSWGMFAPDPPRRSTELVARTHYADGTVGQWRPPAGEPLIAAYRNYHWRKWATAVLNDRTRRLWAPAATWVVRNQDHGGRQPVRVELVRRSRELPPPGSGRALGAWEERPFYSLELELHPRSDGPILPGGPA